MNSLKKCSGAAEASASKGFAMPVKIRSVLVLTAAACLLYACGSPKEDMAYREKAEQAALAVAGYAPGIVTDTINGMTHNFIRSADLKCKVADVLTATTRIEDLVTANGGYASSSGLSSQISYSTAIRFKKDSVLEQLHYHTISTLRLRVPNRQLDTVLGKITGMALFVDYRNLKADDVKMKLFANSLAETRLNNYTKRVAGKIDTKAEAKLNQVVAAEENILGKQVAADDKRMASYDLADQVSYSTLVIELYAAQKTITEVSAVPLAVAPYEPPFMEKFGAAFLQGFELLKSFILAVTGSWGVIIIIAFLVLAGRKLVGIYNKRLNI